MIFLLYHYTSSLIKLCAPPNFFQPENIVVVIISAMDSFDVELFQEEDLINISLEGIKSIINYGSDDNESEYTHTTEANNYRHEELQVDPELSARRHFAIYSDKCRCEPKCDLSDLEKLSLSFSRMSESERRNIIMGMLLPLSARKGKPNELSEYDPTYLQNRKWKRRRTETKGNSTTLYALRGRRVCQNVFPANVQAHSRTLNIYAKQLAEVEEFVI